MLITCFQVAFKTTGGKSVYMQSAAVLYSWSITDTTRDLCSVKSHCSENMTHYA